MAVRVVITLKLGYKRGTHVTRGEGFRNMKTREKSGLSQLEGTTLDMAAKINVVGGLCHRRGKAQVRSK